MAIGQRVQILVDEGTKISLMREYLKNPKIVDQLEEDIKRLNALGEQEAAKAVEARAAIALHESNKKELADQKNELETAKAAHAVDVEEFNRKSSALQEQQNAKEFSLCTREDALAEALKIHAQNVSQLEAQKLDLQKKSQEVFDRIAADKNTNEETKAALYIRETELAKAEQAHKEKAIALKALFPE